MDHNDQVSSMRSSIPQRLLFQPFSVHEIRQLSVVKIVTPLSFNSLGHPVPGGLYDPAMGPVNMGVVCATCGMNSLKCVGHMGHIELPLPVLNPLYHKAVEIVLKWSCLQCHRILIPFTAKSLLIGQLHLLHRGCIVEAQEMSTIFAELVVDDNYDINVDRQIAIKNKIEAHVKEVESRKNLDVAEWKGETDFRNEYIKAASSRTFKGKNCPYCKVPLKKLSSVNKTLLIPNAKVKVAPKFQPDQTTATEDLEVSSSDFTYLMPSDIREHLRKLYESDGALLNALMPVIFQFTYVSKTPTDGLFLEAIPIPPINARPVQCLDGVMSEHPQNESYKKILEDILVINSLLLIMRNDDSITDDSIMQGRLEVVKKLKGNTPEEKLQYCLQGLQKLVDSLLDIDALKTKNPGGLGLKQIIEKKQGIIRMNMMGKRVNFAARTVITPDPNLNIDEIGVPEDFAKKLTYPVPVTYYNVNDLRKMVLNGPFAHPGANFVEYEDGGTTKLSGTDLSQREGIAKKLLTPSGGKGLKIVHRHLVNGDILLLNRQPTLHKPSIMAHKARILKGERTFRMHYANCKSYNADFDGDEMNAHFPQNEVARSEGYNLVSVSKQYLVPKDGTPLSGLIQDHVVSGVRLSMRGRFFTKEEYMQLSFQGLCSHTGNIKYLPPCMIKPVQLWSGKQIISTIILNIVPSGLQPLNLTSKSKISASAWPAPKKSWKAGGTPFSNPSEMSEAEVIIREGELLCGVLDKMHYGATPYSLVHCMHEIYGAESASRLLSAFSKLFTAFLQTEGFTLGVEDILVVKKADAHRTKIISQVRQIGDKVACAALDIPYSEDLRSDLAKAYSKDPSFRALLDHHYKKSLDSFTNDINKTCLPSGLLKKFPRNDLQLMVQSGAKGSTVNTMQISCLLGQIELEGKRPPLMISGRSLPSFPPYDPSPRAGGFVDGRFMTGIRPQEFFFHCMAGREGLIDTAVKTSRSGYLQRCLVKHLEGLTVRYDLTVRDSDGSVVQYLYGEDGMEVTKCQFLTQDQLPFLADNVQALLQPDATEAIKEGSDLKGLKKQKKSLRKWRKSRTDSSKRRPKPFTIYSQQSESTSAFDPETGRTKIAEKLCRKWHGMEEEEKKEYRKICTPTPDTVVAKFQPDRHFGSVTEKMDDMMDKYMKKYGSKVDVQMFEDVVHFKALAALANPGEPVGLLAAQSIGEPSTQMTLNTFHFAGRGEMNVTLGIPRLREILMVASKNMKTPSMEVPFRRDVPKLGKEADRLRKKLAKVTLADVLECVEVTEKLQLSPQRKQLYTLRFKFLPKKCYKENTRVTPGQILKHFEKVFMKQLLFNIKRKGKKTKIIEEEAEEKNRVNGEGDDGENEDDPSPVGRGLTKKRGVAGAGNDYQSSGEDSENDDDDATTQRRRARQNEEHQYSDSEDEDDVQGNENAPLETVKDDEKPASKVDEREEGGRKLAVKSLDYVESYSFDKEHQQWCEVTLAYPTNQDRIDFSVKLKELASRSIITQVEGIRKAFLPSNPNGELVLKTDGKNLMEMYNHMELLDLNRLYTNDIHAVAETFGIEAASKVIVREIQEVFKVYGITVDPRHLTLVADYMTFDGTFRPLSRIGMEGGASPLQQMSFESSLGFLRNSVLRSKKDDLLSPSARLMLGIPVACGTSAFSLLYSANQFQIH